MPRLDERSFHQECRPLCSYIPDAGHSPSEPPCSNLPACSCSPTAPRTSQTRRIWSALRDRTLRWQNQHSRGRHHNTGRYLAAKEPPREWQDSIVLENTHTRLGPANVLPFSGVGRYVMVDSSTAGAARRPLLICRAARLRLVEHRPRVDRPTSAATACSAAVPVTEM